MKAFFSMFRWQELKSQISTVSRRFPVPTVISAVITLLFFILIGGSVWNEVEEIIWKWIMTGIVTFFLACWLTLLWESLKKENHITYFLQLISLAFGELFYLFLSADLGSFENIVFFILTLFGVSVFLFIAPYTKHLKTLWHQAESYYVYFYRVAVVFFLSFIVGGALALLGNIAIATVRTLFDLGYSFSGDFHGYWTALSLAFLTPIFALTQLPKAHEFEENYFNENAFFNFLIRYIVIPFVYVYFFILYAYSAKVLMNFSDWPKGEVSWMVIGFSFLWYVAYMFSYIFECGNKKENHKLITLFRKYFPFVVLPQTAMLFYAIWLRIGQYDLTVNRYFVVIFGIWLLVASLYLALSKKKSLLYIPTLLTLFSIVISIGPWSVYHLPLERQTQRLKNNLIEANILQDGKIVPLQSYDDISEELSGQIHDGIDYVCDFRSCETIIELFPDIYQDIYEKERNEHNKYRIKYPDDEWRQTEYTKPSKWEIVNGVTDAIKVQRYYAWNNQKREVYHIYSNESMFPLDIKNYDMIIEIGRYDSDEKQSYSSVDIKKETLTLEYNGKKEEIDISEVFAWLRSVSGVNGSNNLTLEERTFHFEGKDVQGKIIIDWWTISMKAWDYNEDNYYSLGWYILLQSK